MAGSTDVGKRKPVILIVEDEFLIADMLQGMLEDFGCEAAGPCSDLQEALKCAREMSVDAAYIDLILQDEPAYKVGEVLKERGIPFTFATGLSDEGLTDNWKDHPFVLRKPYVKEDVRKLLDAMLSPANGETHSVGGRRKDIT